MNVATVLYKSGKLYADGLWHCDGCGCFMNSQNGFNRESGWWKCEKCGEMNDVSDRNILTEDMICPDDELTEIDPTDLPHEEIEEETAENSDNN